MCEKALETLETVRPTRGSAVTSQGSTDKTDRQYSIGYKPNVSSTHTNKRQPGEELPPEKKTKVEKPADDDDTEAEEKQFEYKGILHDHEGMHSELKERQTEFKERQVEIEEKRHVIPKIAVNHEIACPFHHNSIDDLCDTTLEMVTSDLMYNIKCPFCYRPIHYGDECFNKYFDKCSQCPCDQSNKIYYCNDCEVLVCKNCASDKHFKNHHDYNFALDTLRRKIQNYRDNLCKLRDSLPSDIQEAKKKQKDEIDSIRQKKATLQDKEKLHEDSFKRLIDLDEEVQNYKNVCSFLQNFTSIQQLKSFNDDVSKRIWKFEQSFTDITKTIAPTNI